MVACAVVPEAEMAIDWVVRACWDVMAWRLVVFRSGFLP